MGRRSLGSLLLLAFGIGVLGSVAQIEHMSGGSTDHFRSQVAAVIETTAKGCEAAKNIAAAGKTSGIQSADSQEIADKCIAAVFDQSKVQPYEVNPSQNPKNYRCVGKTLRVSVVDGRTIENWTAAPRLTAQTCEYCDASGKCTIKSSDDTQQFETFNKPRTPYVSGLHSTQNWYDDQFIVNNDITPAGWMDGPLLDADFSSRFPYTSDFQSLPIPDWLDSNLAEEFGAKPHAFSNLSFSGPVFNETTGKWEGPDALPRYFRPDEYAASPLLEGMPRSYGPGTVYSDSGEIVSAEPNEISVSQFPIKNFESPPLDEQYL